MGAPYHRIGAHIPWQDFRVADPPHGPLAMFKRWAEHRPKCPEYIGLSRAEAVEVARKAGRAERMRIMDLDSGEKMPPWKMDLSPNRPNVVVRDGKVVSAALF
jgi:hypothetical protein